MDSLGFIYLNIIKIKELVDLAYNYLPSNEAEHFWPNFFSKKKNMSLDSDCGQSCWYL